MELLFQQIETAFTSGLYFVALFTAFGLPVMWGAVGARPLIPCKWLFVSHPPCHTTLGQAGPLPGDPDVYLPSTIDQARQELHCFYGS
jgi:hypothetical protein